MAMRSNELNDVKTAIRSELQTMSLVVSFRPAPRCQFLPCACDHQAHAVSNATSHHFTLQRVRLQAVLLATVAIVPFATPASDLHWGTVETNFDWISGSESASRLAYSTLWTLSLVMNMAVVFCCTILFLALPHLTQV